MTDDRLENYTLAILDAVVKKIMAKRCPACDQALADTSGIKYVALSYDEESNSFTPYAVCRGCLDASGPDEATAAAIDRRLMRSAKRYTTPEMVALIPGFGESLIRRVRRKKTGKRGIDS